MSRGVGIVDYDVTGGFVSQYRAVHAGAWCALELFDVFFRQAMKLVLVLLATAEDTADSFEGRFESTDENVSFAVCLNGVLATIRLGSICFSSIDYRDLRVSHQHAVRSAPRFGHHNK